MSQFHVIIPAAGTGSRMQSTTPKQYQLIHGIPILLYSLQAFLSLEKITSVIIVLHSEDTLWESLGFSHPRLSVLRCGGQTRTLTVKNALDQLKNSNETDWVLVHDAARPGITKALIERLINELADDAVGGILALPIADTVKRADEHIRIAETVPRASLWQAQTPQMFRYEVLKKALDQVGSDATDEAQAVEALGLAPKLVMGSPSNMKVTYPQDMDWLSLLIEKH
jgi:2-C-methyl-D-erythritol 4-phosphate cytidylyltransferase